MGGRGGAGTGGNGADSAGGGTGGNAGNAGTGGSFGPIAGCPLETNPPPAIAQACMQCLMAQRNPESDGCCDIADDVGLALCQTASACARANDCNVDGDVTLCYSGTNSADCDNQPNGPCVGEMTAAAGRNVVTRVTDMPTPPYVLARFGDSTYALGRADNIQNVAGLYCPMACGLPSQ